MIPGNEIISSYGLDVKDVTIEPIEQGLINATWQIKNETNHFILQKINHCF